jgi:hypothetical protein
MADRKRACKECGRAIRTKSPRAVFLYLTLEGREVWICGQRCLDEYNAGDDIGGEMQDGSFTPEVDALEIEEDAIETPVALIADAVSPETPPDEMEETAVPSRGKPRIKRHSWTPDFIAPLKARVAAGETYAAIARELGISTPAVWTGLNREKKRP